MSTRRSMLAACVAAIAFVAAPSPAQVTVPQGSIPAVSLPARFDLVDTLSGTATGWTGVVPGKEYGSKPFGAPNSESAYGWLDATDVTGWDDDIDDFVMVSLGAGDDDFTAREERLRDGHAFTEQKVFKVKVPAASPHVRVRVVVGRHDRSLHGIKVFRRNGSTNAANLMTVEAHPWVLPVGDAFEDIYGDPAEQGDHGGTGAWTRTRVAKADLEPLCTTGSEPFANFGGYRSFWFDVQASNNDVAAITFTSDAEATHADIAVAAIEIYDATEPPLEFSFAGSTPELVKNTSYSFTTGDETHVDAALVDLNAGAIDDAIDHFMSVSDATAKANGLLWSAGWLGGEAAEGSVYGDPLGSPDSIDDGQALFASDGYEWELIDEAIDLLTVGGTSEPTHAHAAEWLDRARQYQRALRHHRLRAYPSITFPAGGDALENPIVIPDPPPTLCLPGHPGRLVINNGIAEALWRDIAAQDVDQYIDHFIDTPVNATAGVAINPLFFKAAVYLALNRHARSPINSEDVDGESFSSRQESYQPFEALEAWGLREPDGSGGFEGPFADSAILAIGQHMARYADYDATSESSLYQNWDPVTNDVLYGTSPDVPFWWDGLTNGESLTSGGTAATALWDFRRRFDAAFGWWTTSGYGGGEFGGGGGDDVELLLQGLTVTGPFPGSEVGVESVMGAIIDDNLEEHEASGHFIGDAVIASASDSEHTGEYTGNPLFAALTMWPGEPYYTEYARQSFQRMVQPVAVGGMTGNTWTKLVDEIGTGALEIDLSLLGDRHDDPTRSYASGTWSDPTSAVDLGLRYFRSWRLDAEGAQITGPSGKSPVGDVPLNGRVIRPAFRLLDQYRSPAVAQLLRQWAEFWWYVAMDHDNKLTTTSASSQDKPVGVLPPIVQFRRSVGGVKAGLVHGDPNAATNPRWFDGPSGADFSSLYSYENGVVESGYLYGLFRWRYRDQLTSSADRVDYLLPIYLASRYVAKRAWVDASSPGTEIAADLNVVLTSPGRDGWIAKHYVETPGFLWELYLALPYLYDEAGAIATRIDSSPLSLGFESSASEVEEILDWAVEGIRENGSVYFQDRLASPATETAISANLDEGATWLTDFFPLVTETVLYTDKVFLSPQPSNGGGKAFSNAYAIQTGGPLAQSPNEFVRWRGAPVAGEPAPMLMSIVVDPFDDLEDVDGALWTAEIAHFQEDGAYGTSRVVEVELSPRFPEGVYDITLSDGSTLWYDAVALGPFGATVSIPFPYADTAWDGSNVVTLEVERVSDLSPSAPEWSLEVVDAAVGRRDLDIEVDAGAHDFTLTYRVHNLGSVDISSATVGTFVHVSDDDGETWTQAAFASTSPSVAVPSTFDATDDPDDASRLAWLQPMTSTPATLDVDLPGGWTATEYLVRATIQVDALTGETRLGNNAAERTYSYESGVLTEL